MEVLMLKTEKFQSHMKDKAETFEERKKDRAYVS
jgi:hypothetical protein